MELPARACEEGAGGLFHTLTGSLPAGWALRWRTDGDLYFLSRLYASTRQDELGQVPWSAEQKTAFLHDQFTKQHTHYLAHYPKAQWLLIEQRGEPVGRIYVDQTDREIHLMEVSLLPPLRGQGLGSGLMRALLAYADRAGLPVTLHVEPFNPAARLYVRLGFVELETRGYYRFMVWRCDRVVS